MTITFPKVPASISFLGIRSLVQNLLLLGLDDKARRLAPCLEGIKNMGRPTQWFFSAKASLGEYDEVMAILDNPTLDKPFDPKDNSGIANRRWGWACQGLGRYPLKVLNMRFTLRKGLRHTLAFCSTCDHLVQFLVIRPLWVPLGTGVVKTSRYRPLAIWPFDA